MLTSFSIGQTVTVDHKALFVCFDIWMVIASFLDIHQVVNMALVGKNMRNISVQTLKNRLSVVKMLRNYMPPTLYDPFRELQHYCDALISGSAVVQLLTEANFGSIDLDIYVPQAKSRIFLEFMHAHFEYHSTTKHGLQLDAPDHGGPRPLHILARDDSDYWIATQSENVKCATASVATFAYGSRFIHVISCLVAPMDTILTFHSTVVMNIVSSTHIHCLYPKMTIVDKKALITGQRSTNGDLCLVKYRARGYTFFSSVNNSTLRSCPVSPLSTKRRFVGDKHSFSFALPSKQELPKINNVYLSSWELWYQRNTWNAHTSYCVFTAPRLSIPWICCDNKILRLMRIALHRAMANNADDFQQLDDDTAKAIQETFPTFFSHIEF
ncbi:hypothetical protein CVT24_009831 [Panaeolus cyanescens]|uniref:Uncharacterized protein n=1 Tax=Panaeolus cyanescens TaxID=181874 RepID=A0A409WWC4_9AGAR|nr:hypothetical protein CVT24_009831 [Panaeolus cyanescens]